MAYDVFGNWAATTGPLAPIYDSCAPENPASINSAIAIFTKQGFKPSQMVLGIPAYARSYELTSPKLVPRTEGKLVSYYYQNHTTTAPVGYFPPDCGSHRIRVTDCIFSENIARWKDWWSTNDRRVWCPNQLGGYLACERVDGEGWLISWPTFRWKWLHTSLWWMQWSSQSYSNNHKFD